MAKTSLLRFILAEAADILRFGIIVTAISLFLGAIFLPPTIVFSAEDQTAETIALEETERVTSEKEKIDTSLEVTETNEASKDAPAKPIADKEDERDTHKEKLADVIIINVYGFPTPFPTETVNNKEAPADNKLFEGSDTVDAIDDAATEATAVEESNINEEAIDNESLELSDTFEESEDALTESNDTEKTDSDISEEDLFDASPEDIDTVDVSDDEAKESTEVESTVSEGQDEAPWAFDEDWESDFDEGPANDEKTTSDIPLTWRFEAAFKNIVQTDRQLHLEDAYKKDEISALLELQYGGSDDYLFSLTGLYFFPTFLNETIGGDYVYSASSKTCRNLRISGKSGEVIFREFYYNWSREKYRVRIGNQIFGWGTADFLNSTDYFNPSDLRELLFKDQDQVSLGVPAVSGLFFFEKFTIESVFVPVHTASVFPETQNYWAVKMIENDYPLIFEDTEPMDSSSKNFGYGARLASTWEGIDFSFSGYHGPDNAPVLLPLGTVLIENQTVSVCIGPQYFIVDYLGCDFAFTYEDFVFQAEAAYSPNKHGFLIQDTNRPQDLVFPYHTRKTDYLSYSLGFNYFIPLQKLLPGHAGESLLTVEWFQARYFEDEVERPQITDFLTCRFQDTYFDDKVSVSMTGIVETYNGGIILWPQIGYDFQNGVTAEIGYVSIEGQGEGDYQIDSVFYYYKNNDSIMVNFRYAFP